MPNRAILFVDGNNWYHGLRDIGVTDLGRLNYATISNKLLGPREWIETRYYIGQVRQHGNIRLYSEQRRFLASLQATDRRITHHLGRLEPRSTRNEAADELLHYLHALTTRIDTRVFHDLVALANRHRNVTVFVEKAVDVMLAVDMVVMAERNAFNTAYLLSADGDYTHAVVAVRSLGKKVFAVSPLPGAQLAGVVNSFIRLTPDWFTDCY
jgi:uncharacterized LabA/DUF88 family protein